MARGNRTQFGPEPAGENARAGTRHPAVLEALGVLTPPQKEQWDNLLGPPCRFSIGRASTATGHAAAAPGAGGSRPSPGR
jgi:hypothetical protein